MQVPRIEKIMLNMGVGEAVADKKIMDNAVGDMRRSPGQKPLVTKSRKSIATFKIREGYPIGCKVTLRGARMYEFLDRLVNIAMPRIRDFRGISGKSFDGRGNYNMGVKEQIIFPEIEYDKIDAMRGMNITISTTAKTDEEGKSAALGIQISVQELRNDHMAKTALINRDQKRRKTVKKFAAKRAELMAIVNNQKLVPGRALRSAAETAETAAECESPVRLRNRCALTGRPRGVFRKFGLARGKLRDIAMRGEIPGVIKASW